MSEDYQPFAILPVEIMQRADLSATDKLVMMGLYSFADRYGCCWPSYVTLAERVGMGKATVRRCLDRLEEVGLVSREERQRQDGGQSSNMYTLLWVTHAQDEHPPAQADHIPVLKESTLELEPVELEDPPCIPPIGDQVDQVFTLWREVTGRNGTTKLDDRRRKRITWALKTYGLDATLTAVRNVDRSDFHMGRDPKTEGKAYNDLTLILRNAEKVEWFLALAPPPAVMQAEDARHKRIARALVALEDGADLETARNFCISDDELREALDMVP